MKKIIQLFTIILALALATGDVMGQTYTVSTFAGNGSYGYADGTVAAASFNNPIGVALDASGNVYVADGGNSKIRLISTAGVVTTFAGSVYGYVNGTGTAASFTYPRALAVDASGNVFVTSTNEHTIRKITAAGVVTTFAGSQAGSGYGYADGTGTDATFFNPSGLAIDASGNIYVADEGNSRIRKITAAGVVTTLAGSGAQRYADGIGTAASFNSPTGVAVDVLGNVYVADAGNNRIRKITPAGVVTTVAGSGTRDFADGTGTTASFNNPSGVAIDASGNIFVSDSYNTRIRKITAAGVVTTIAGSATYGYADGIGANAMLGGFSSITLGTSGNLYVAEYGSQRIRKLTPSCTIPATPTITASGATTFNTGSSVTLMSSATSGNLWSTGATTQSITVSASGDYSVSTFSEVCTSAVSTATTVTVNTVVIPTGYLIPDTAFARALRGIVPSAMNGDYLDTTSAALAGIDRLDIQRLRITNISGVKYFTNLRGIYAASNAITFIPELPSGLENLSLFENLVTSFPPSLPANLNSLDVSYNPIAYIPELPSTLLTLYANNTNISVLPSLPNAMFQLNVSGSGINCIENVPTGPFPSWRTQGFQTDVAIGLCNPPCTTPATPTIWANGSTTINTGGSVVLWSSATSGNVWSNGATTQSITVIAAGTYSVQVINETCSSSVSTGIEVIIVDNTVQPSWVLIPDDAFAAALRNIIPSAMHGNYLDTLDASAINLNTLDVSGRNIYSLEGVHHFPNLEGLFASGNLLVDIPVLPTTLKALSIPGNDIQDVSNLPDGLTSLDLSLNTNLSYLNALPRSLEVLYVSGTGLTQLPTLPSGMFRLNSDQTAIVCLPNIPAGPFPDWYSGDFESDMGLTTCSPYANSYLVPDANFAAYLRELVPSCMNGDYLDTTCSSLGTISTINCGNRNISSINGIKYFRFLDRLICNGNNITVLPRLSNSLMTLNATGNPVNCLPNIPTGPFRSGTTFISDIGTTICGTAYANSVFIPDAAFASYLNRASPTCMNGNWMDTTCINLGSLELSGLGIVSLEGLQYIRTVTKVSASNNAITALPRLPSRLTTLSIQNNAITWLDIQGGALTSLDISGNPLTAINTWPSTLNVIYMGSTPITTIPNIPNSVYYLNTLGGAITCLPNIPVGPFPSWYRSIFSNDRDLTVCNTSDANRFLIPDANFAAYLRTIVPSCMSGDYLDTTCSSLGSVTSITATNRNISNLTGFKYLRNIQEVDLRNNYLSSLPTLPNQLWRLMVTGNYITCIPNVPSGPFANGRTFTSDVTSVCNTSTSGLYLIVDNNFANYLRTIVPSCMSGNYLDTNCTALATITDMDCSDRGITNLDGIVFFRNLKSLYARSNGLASLPYRMPRNLVSLSISKNVFEVMPALPSNLQSLDISQNYLGNVTSTLPNTLLTLYIGENPALTSFYQLPNSLYYLQTDGCDLTCLPNIPTGAFPAWWTRGFISTEGLGLCVTCNVSTPSITAGGVTAICTGSSVQLTASYASAYRWSTGATTRSISVSNAGSYSVTTFEGACTSATSSSTAVSVSTCSPTNSVLIPHTFAAWLNDNSAYAPAMNGDYMDTTNNNIRNTTQLTMNGIGLTDLNGIQYFRSLVTLIARDNALTAIPTLPASLRELTLRNNAIASVSSLPSSLTSLDLSQNPMPSLPTLPASLQTLYVNTMPFLTALPSIPNSVYYLECNNAVFTCLPNIPTGPFASWSNGSFTNPQNLSVCGANPSIGIISSTAMLSSTSLSFYPNPASSTLHISGLSSPASQIIITTATGVQVSQVISTELESIEVPVQHLAAGVYFLNVDGKAYRFVKQ